MDVEMEEETGVLPPPSSSDQVMDGPPRIVSDDEEDPAQDSKEKHDAPEDDRTDCEQEEEPRQQQQQQQQQQQSPAATNDRDDDDDHAQCCPVCLHHPDDDENDDDDVTFLVHGPCGHALCVDCMERVLNAQAAFVRWPPQSAADLHLSAPTLGRCPICRSELSLFDIVLLQQESDGCTNNNNNNNSGGKTNAAPKKHLCTKRVDCWNEQEELEGALTANDSDDNGTPTSPLNGAVYVPYRGKPGQLSFHWDWYRLKRHSEEPNTTNRPFLNLTHSIRARPDHWKLEDGSMASRIVFFEKGCHFHEPSRTFHGTILWPKRLNGSYEWNVILGFSKDYRFLSSGRVHMKRERKLELVDGTEEDRDHLQRKLQEYTTEQKELCKYPLDGRWTVTRTNNSGQERRIELHVIGNEYRQSKWAFHISFDDPRHPSVQWPRSTHRQWVEEGVDLIHEPVGPPAGGQIQWKTTDPRFPGLCWTRQTVGPVPLPKVILFGMGHEKHLYQRLHAKTDRSIPQYNGGSVFGNVFTKRLYIGSASYHFLSPTNSFISYRHPACRDLPTLDDGSPLPTRVDFHNLVWEPQERKLTGTIEWEKDFGTSWNDNVRWTLTAYFDTEYMVILKGGIQCEWCKERRARPRPPRPPPQHRPPPVPVYVPPPPEEEEKEDEAPELIRNEEWVMSGYGYDQVYVNAAAVERYRSKTTPVELDEDEDQKEEEDSEDRDGDENNELSEDADQNGEDEEKEEIDYTALGEQHKKRLKEEGATQRSIDFLSYLFHTVAENKNVNPIDFLVD